MYRPRAKTQRPLLRNRWNTGQPSESRQPAKWLDFWGRFWGFCVHLVYAWYMRKSRRLCSCNLLWKVLCSQNLLLHHQKIGTKTTKLMLNTEICFLWTHQSSSWRSLIFIFLIRYFPCCLFLSSLTGWGLANIHDFTGKLAGQQQGSSKKTPTQTMQTMGKSFKITIDLYQVWFLPYWGFNDLMIPGQAPSSNRSQVPPWVLPSFCQHFSGWFVWTSYPGEPPASPLKAASETTRNFRPVCQSCLILFGNGKFATNWLIHELNKIELRNPRLKCLMW